jgi:hypothetical protein
LSSQGSLTKLYVRVPGHRPRTTEEKAIHRV